MSRRLWRVMRGLGRSMGDALRRPGREEQEAREEFEQAMAERDARAEIEGRAIAPPLAGLPERMAPGDGDRLGDLVGTTSGSPAQVEAIPIPCSVPADPALAPHYAALELPPSANLGEIEHAYKRLKEAFDPARFAGDPVGQARARQQDARLDEAYLSLRQALVRERRL